MGGEIINTQLASRIELKWLYLIVSGYRSCGEQHKEGIELMCTFVEKLLSFSKKYAPAGQKILKTMVAKWFEI